MDIVKNAGTGFAFPSQTAYIEKGESIDKKRSNEVEQVVRKWPEI